MTTYQILNRTRGGVLAHQAELADTAATRTKGLLGRDGLAEGSALIIDPCNSIHTFFMRFSIDVLFVTSEGQVVRVLENLVPWRLTRMYFRARKVIEFPAGTLQKVPCQPGDQLEFVSVPSPR
ncbi:MAG: DUF192 domain-containing protein [Myxococcota bacterium]